MNKPLSCTSKTVETICFSTALWATISMVVYKWGLQLLQNFALSEVKLLQVLMLQKSLLFFMSWDPWFLTMHIAEFLNFLPNLLNSLYCRTTHVSTESQRSLKLLLVITLGVKRYWRKAVKGVIFKRYSTLKFGGKFRNSTCALQSDFKLQTLVWCHTEAVDLWFANAPSSVTPTADRSFQINNHNMCSSAVPTFSELIAPRLIIRNHWKLLNAPLIFRNP